MNLGKKVEIERKRRGWTQGEVVALVPGLTQQNLDRLEKRDSKSSAYTLGIAAAFGLTVEELLSGASQPPADEGTPTGAPLALTVSHRMAPDQAPLLSWDEVVVGAKKHERFSTILPDDALGEKLPAGTEVLWSSPAKRRPLVGRAALVTDQAGQLHARWLGQGARSGEFTATSHNPLYRSFDGVDQSFQIVAVFKSKMEPDDQ